MNIVAAKRIAASLVLLAGFTASAHASTITYDAVADFVANSTANPNGNWTYGSGATGSYSAGTGFTAYTVSGSSWDNSGWAYQAGAANGLPAVGYNTPNAHPGAGGLSTVDVPQTELWLHPGPGTNQDSIVLFTATTSGLYNLSSEFTGRSSSGVGDGVNVGVYLNGVLLSGTYLNGVYGSQFTYSNGAIFLNSGDVLTFDLNKNGAYGSDSTGFEASLTTRIPDPSSVPEPSSIALLGTGLLSVAGVARRKFLR